MSGKENGERKHAHLKGEGGAQRTIVGSDERLIQSLVDVRSRGGIDVVQGGGHCDGQALADVLGHVVSHSTVSVKATVESNVGRAQVVRDGVIVLVGLARVALLVAGARRQAGGGGLVLHWAWGTPCSRRVHGTNADTCPTYPCRDSTPTSHLGSVGASELCTSVWQTPAVEGMTGMPGMEETPPTPAWLGFCEREGKMRDSE